MKQLNEEGSTSMMISFLTIIFGGVFAWIGSGYIVDKLVESGIAFNAASSIPMSMERANTINWLTTGFQLIIVLGIVLPAIVYAVVIAKRRSQSEVFG
jgi:hypothetical protein